MPTIKKRGRAEKQQTPEDEFRSIARQVADLAAANKQILTIVTAVVAVVVIVVAGYRFMRSQQEQKAAPLVANAYGYYSPLQGETDYSRALDLFRKAQSEYPSTTSGAIAQYYIGNCLANLGRYDEALKEYQVFINKYSGDKFLLGLVYERIGYVDSALGKQADAVKAFEQSETLTGPGAATMELARLYEASGNAAEAQQKYKTIADKLAGTAWGMEALGKVQKIVPAPASSAPQQSKPAAK